MNASLWTFFWRNYPYSIPCLTKAESELENHMTWFYKNQLVNLNNTGIDMIIKSRSINDTAMTRI